MMSAVKRLATRLLQVAFPILTFLVLLALARVAVVSGFALTAAATLYATIGVIFVGACALLYFGFHKDDPDSREKIRRYYREKVVGRPIVLLGCFLVLLVLLPFTYLWGNSYRQVEVTLEGLEIEEYSPLELRVTDGAGSNFNLETDRLRNLKFTLASPSASSIQVKSIALDTEASQPNVQQATFPFAPGAGYGPGPPPVKASVSLSPESKAYTLEMDKTSKLGSGEDPTVYETAVVCEQGYQHRIVGLEIEWIDLNQQDRTGSYRVPINSEDTQVDCPKVTQWEELVSSAVEVKMFYSPRSGWYQGALSDTLQSLTVPPKGYTVLAHDPNPSSYQYPSYEYQTEQVFRNYMFGEAEIEDPVPGPIEIPDKLHEESAVNPAGSDSFGEPQEFIIVKDKQRKTMLLAPSDGYATDVITNEDRIDAVEQKYDALAEQLEREALEVEAARATVQDFYAAQAEGQFKRAYLYLSSTFRTEVDRATFTERARSVEKRIRKPPFYHPAEDIQVIAMSENAATITADVCFEGATNASTEGSDTDDLCDRTGHISWELLNEDGEWKLDEIISVEEP